MKKQIGELICLRNSKLAKQIGDEMTTWQNLQLMKKQVGQTNSWWNNQFDEKITGWNNLLTK